MLTPVELENIFNEIGLPEGGRRLVAKARREAPVRQVRSSRSNLITRYPSQKMGRVIETESHTVEFAAMLRYEWDPAVLEYYPQPMEIDQKVKAPGGKATRLQHTPDFLLIKRDVILVEEWREEDRLLKLALNSPGKFLREVEGWRYPLAEDFFAEQGLEYRLRSADELPQQYIQNLFFLGTYLDANYPELEERDLEVLRRAFQNKASIHLKQLMDAPGLTSDSIYKAIADKILAFDLYNDNLGETDRVMVFRDEPTMVFLQKSMAPSVGLPQERLDFSIQPGGKMVLDKTEYDILFVDGDRVSTKCREVIQDFPLDIIEKLHRKGQLTPAPSTRISASLPHLPASWPPLSGCQDPASPLPSLTPFLRGSDFVSPGGQFLMSPDTRRTLSSDRYHMLIGETPPSRPAFSMRSPNGSRWAIRSFRRPRRRERTASRMGSNSRW